MYTIKELANLAHISTRTLRYYDEFDLLKLSSFTNAGYRIYNNELVDKLQQIIFYRALGVSLKEIDKILKDSSFNAYDALKNHQKLLL